MFDRKAWMKEYSKKYREDNRERLLLQKKEYYYSNKEYCSAKQKEYRENNPEKRRLTDKAWREANKERKAALDKLWRINNKDRANATHRKYAATHKGRLGAKKRAAVRKNQMKGLKTSTVQLVYEDNIKKYGTLTCYLCLDPIEFKNDHLEHKIPLSRGGNNLYENLAVACMHCNLSKFNMTEQEYRDLKCLPLQ